jgi:hypothetical protein
LFAGTRFTVEAAAAMLRRPGVVYLPALFWIDAKGKWLASAYATST